MSHTLNNSSSKQAFSFGIGNRFKKGKDPICSQAFYDFPTAMQGRAAGFGVGKRETFGAGKKQGPDPTADSLPSHFDFKRRSLPVLNTFGSSHEAGPFA